MDYIFQCSPVSTALEITDPDDPDYENPETEDTNETLLMKHTESSTPLKCMVCPKMFYNEEIFYKHVYWHANNQTHHEKHLLGMKDLITFENQNVPFVDTMSALDQKVYKDSLLIIQEMTVRYSIVMEAYSGRFCSIC